MEWEELKNTWLSLDATLSSNNKINERIVKEVLKNKSKKALSKLTGYELFGTTLCFVLLPFLIFMLDKFYRPNMLANTVIYLGIGILAIVCVTQSIKLLMLSKIDFAKALSSNVRLVQRYKLFIKREIMAGYIFGPIVLVLITLGMASLGSKVEAWRWVALIAATIFTVVISIWQYKKIYAANIQSIMSNLEELKELEEDK